MNLKLFIRILPHLTLKKVLNFFFLESSFLLSRILRRPIMKGLPWALSVEPTTHCNLRCPECPTGLRILKRPTGSMNMDLFSHIIDSMSRHLLYITLYFQGEPFLNKDLLQMIRLAKSKKLLVATSTNGHFLTPDTAKEVVESGLDRLIISLDGTDQSAYSKYRVGGDINTVISGIRQVVYWKKKLKKSFPFIELQFLVLGTNEHQLKEIKLLAKNLGVDKLSLKSAQLNNLENNPFLTSVKRFARYSNESSNKTGIHSDLPDYCHRMWNSPVITWEGIIIPCCFDKDAEHKFGNIQDNDFSNIWISDNYQSFRQQIFKNRKNITMCCNCTEGLKQK